MLMRMLILGAVLIGAGCNAGPVITHIGGGSSSAPVSLSITGEPAFALEVARSGVPGPMETVSGNWHLSGFYTGSSQGCRYVSIRNLGLSRTTHYSVCGGAARERSEVAPTYPGGNDAERVRRSVMDSAWRNGQAEQQWEVYRVSSVRIGPPRSDGCATVSTLITYDGMLVRHEDERVCH